MNTYFLSLITYKKRSHNYDHKIRKLIPLTINIFRLSDGRKRALLTFKYGPITIQKTTKDETMYLTIDNEFSGKTFYSKEDLNFYLLEFQSFRGKTSLLRMDTDDLDRFVP